MEGRLHHTVQVGGSLQWWEVEDRGRLHEGLKVEGRTRWQQLEDRVMLWQVEGREWCQEVEGSHAGPEGGGGG